MSLRINRLLVRTAPLFVMAAIALAGCGQNKSDHENNKRASDTINHPGTPHMNTQGAPAATANIKPSQAAATQPSNQNVNGTVTFTQSGDGVKVVANLNGLSPGKHGFHIHDKGDLSDPELKSAGGHFNPTKHKHGGPDTADHHAGDLGNITADASGHATLEATVQGVSLEEGGGANSIIGKSVVVHAKEDDLKSDPAGKSGGRIAGGVIELQK